ncbi:MAG: helix-turn-helix transcriptional regulator [Clostridia bacterium]|nr:helix-turn-helix transcriptional regulator [Clostridia bacterium]
MIHEFIRKRIANLRLAQNISARKLSVEIGQNQNYIAHIENGQSNVSIENLEVICDYFGISPADFFDDKTEYPLQYRELIEKLNKLDALELETVMNFVNILIKDKK